MVEPSSYQVAVRRGRSMRGLTTGRAATRSRAMMLPMDAIGVVTEMAARRLARSRARPAERGLPPGPDAPPVLQLAGFLYQPEPFLRACREQYGSTFTIRPAGVPPIVMLSDPADVHDVFASDGDDMHAGEANQVLEPFLGAHSVLVLDGSRHKEQRRLLLPPFRGERMRAYGEAMRDIAAARARRWPIGRPFAMQPETQAITLDVILKTVFGMEEGAEQDRMRALLVEALSIMSNPLYLIRVFQRDLGPRSPWGRFVRLREEAFREMSALMEKRRREASTERGDVLSLLLLARHEDGTTMSDAEIHDELLTLLVAGHETTATALSWAFHRLTLHGDMLARVQRELDEAFPDGAVDPARVRELAYLDAFCKETLRVHPVVPGVGRVIVRATRAGEVELAEGTLVACSAVLAHTDPNVWPDPTRFDPTRFIDARPSPSEYFPFGGGIRRCIGEAFALYEMRVVLATILLDLAPERATRRPVRAVRRNITLTPSGGLRVKMRRRS
jgi:cytochrome P450